MIASEGRIETRSRPGLDFPIVTAMSLPVPGWKSTGESGAAAVDFAPLPD
jgi:hypothetical protein